MFFAWFITNDRLYMSSDIAPIRNDILLINKSCVHPVLLLLFPRSNWRKKNTTICKEQNKCKIVVKGRPKFIDSADLSTCSYRTKTPGNTCSVTIPSFLYFSDNMLYVIESMTKSEVKHSAFPFTSGNKICTIDGTGKPRTYILFEMNWSNTCFRIPYRKRICGLTSEPSKIQGKSYKFSIHICLISAGSKTLDTL